LSFIVGVGLAPLFLKINHFFYFFVVIVYLLFSWRDKKRVTSLFCLIFFVLGVWRYQSFKLNIENNDLVQYLNKEISFSGIIDERPEPGLKSTKIEVKVDGSNSKVLLTTWKYPEYHYGDRLKIKGKLEEPVSFNDFDYKSYLEKDGIYAIMYQPQIELIESNQGNFIKGKLLFFKKKLKNVVNLVLPSPQSGLLEALFFGDEENISKDWIYKFNMTGTRHITAVSGMNITIISALVSSLFLFLGFWRNQAFYFSVVFIIFYVSIIGAPSSGVRAGIMGILFLLSQYFGRRSDGSRIIILSAVLMLLFNPLLLTMDVGFQLSFLAILGLVYLQPIFSNWLKGMRNVFEIRYTLSATLAAQTFTLPILIYNFGRISLISPIINIFIVPLITMVTILGFVLSFIGLLSIPLAIFLSFPVWLILTYIFKMVDFFSKISFANITLNNVSFVWVILFYLLLGLFILKKKTTERLERL